MSAPSNPLRSKRRLAVPGRFAGKDALKSVVTSISTLLWKLTGRTIPECVSILVYHRVVPVAGLAVEPTWNVTPDRFRCQLAGLQQRGFQFWPLSRVLQYQQRGQAIPRRVVVLTFDDGYENNLTHALPVMKDLGVPGTIFLTTAFLNSSQPFPFDPWGMHHAQVTPPDAWRPLTTAQCHELLNSGLVELGAHTHTHQDFRGRPDDFAEDMRQNMRILQNDFGLSDVTFAFPYGRSRMGYASAELVAAAQDAGAVCALTTDARTIDPLSEPYDWGRFNVYQCDTMDSLIAKFAGWYGWAPRTQARLLRWRNAHTSWRTGHAPGDTSYDLVAKRSGVVHEGKVIA